jgi:hypothetical protein
MATPSGKLGGFHNNSIKGSVTKFIISKFIITRFMRKEVYK